MEQGPEPPARFVDFITAPEAAGHPDDLVADIAALVAQGALTVRQAYGLLRAAAGDEDGLAPEIAALVGAGGGGGRPGPVSNVPPPPPGQM